MKKADCIVFAFIAFVFFLFLFINKLMASDASVVKVYVDKELVSERDISTDFQCKINGTDGISLDMIIENCKVFVSGSECPDKLCERSGSIQKSGESIICLPGRIVISIESDNLPEYDSVSR